MPMPKFLICTMLPAGAPTELIRQILDVNVIGLSLFTREVLTDMRERGVDDGHVFHIGR